MPQLCHTFLYSLPQRALEDLEDASNELMLSDDDVVRYVVGELLVHLDKDAAEERIQKEVEQTEQQAQELEGDLEGVKGQMQQLKAVLYAKFGSSINLEE